MKKYSIFLLAAAALAAAACSVDENSPSVKNEPSKDGGKVYTFQATAADVATRSYFNESEQPSKYIYWDDTDEFDFHDITSGTPDVISTEAVKPTQIGSDNKSVVISHSAHDYAIITYPKGHVTVPDSTIVYKMVDQINKQGKTTQVAVWDTLVGASYVRVSVPKVQTLSSTFSPSALPIASKKIALSDAAKQAVASGADSVAVDYTEPVKLYPLAGLANVTLKRLPGVGDSKIDKVYFVAEAVTTTTSNGGVISGIRGNEYFSLDDTLSVISRHVSGEARMDISLENGSVEYKDSSATVSFVATHSVSKMKSLTVTVYLEDGTVVKKKFDTSKNPVGFSKSRISYFTLDFTGGTVKTSSERFSVEWSQGYLVYDSENKAYKIGDKQDIGLYFKFGSPNAIAFYDSNEDWLSRIRPKDLVNQEIGGTGGRTQQVTADGQTMANGTDNFYNGYSATKADWRSHPYYTASDGVVTAGAMTTYTDYLSWAQGLTSWSGSNDPCSLVKVASGEKGWRLPTDADIKDLINVGTPGAEYGNFDGTDIANNDGKSRYVKYTDGDQTLYFMAAGYVQTGYSRAYQNIQMLYGQKYNIYFISGEYHGTEATNTTNYALAHNLSLASYPSSTTKPGTANAQVNRKNNYSGTNSFSYATCVRCVRDK